jgi:hypothetical protein
MCVGKAAAPIKAAMAMPDVKVRKIGRIGMRIPVRVLPK